MNRLALLLAASIACEASAREAAVTLAGPAMGTTYRVTLARGLPNMSDGEIHREVEQLLERIDRAMSTWREDSEASLFNRAPAGAWVEVSADLIAVVRIARQVHADSHGAFDITAAPAGSGRPVGMRHLESRDSPPALRKQVDGLAIDLGGIGPGYAVDEIGDRLARLGSADHLVELGGEVRAWGRRADGVNWRVRLRREAAAGRQDAMIELADGGAIATSSVKPGRSPVDPRTGRVVAATFSLATVRASSCAVADACAVAAVVLGIQPGPDGTIDATSQSSPFTARSWK
jgi:thiamine biosynthesis lipoprotein